MSFEFIELNNSRELNDSTVAEQQVQFLRFTVLADDAEEVDDTLARSAVRHYLPLYFRNRKFQTFRLVPKGCNQWDLEAQYGRQKPGTVTLNFETSEQKVRLTCALPETDPITDEELNNGKPWQEYFPAEDPDNPGDELPEIDFKGLIGVKHEGGTIKAEGIDVGVGGKDMAVDVDFGPGARLDGGLLDMFEEKAWHVNSDEIQVVISGVYRHFDPGELLYRGIGGSQKSAVVGEEDDQAWEGKITARFSVERNLRGVTLFGVPDCDKDGWDYAEPVHEEEVRDDEILPKVIGVVVSRVYPRTALSGLFFDSVVDEDTTSDFEEEFDDPSLDDDGDAGFDSSGGDF